MFALIPCLTLLAFYACLRRVVEGRRMALLVAATLWGVCVVTITETLSVFRAIDRGTLAAAWSVAGAVAVCILWRFRAKPIMPASGIGTDAFIHVQVSLCATIAAVIGVIALAAPPNTVDVTAYHAPRVAMWLQHKSVAHYATDSLRQLVYAPFSEFVQLQFMVLTRSDLLTNASTWFSFVLTIIAASVLTQKLGGSSRVQAFAALLVATIPQGLATASSAKNDWTVALWITLTAVFATHYLQAPSLPRVIAAASACCLAFLAKGTGPILALGAVVLLCLPRPHLPVRRLAVHLVVSVCVLVLAVPTLVRNYRDLGVVVALPAWVPKAGHTEIERPTVSSLYSNALRNASLHLITPSPRLTSDVVDVVVRLHSLAGINPNDPDTTFALIPYGLKPISLHEAVLPNNIHFTLALAAGLITLVLSRFRRLVPLRVAIGMVLVSAIAFCLFIKWMPWNTRLHLPIFVLASCCIAIAAGLLPRLAMPALTAVVVVGAAPALFANPIRMLIGPDSVFVLDRGRQYFRDSDVSYEQMAPAIEKLRSTGCRRIGFDLITREIEYPLFPMLGALTGERRIWPVGVSGPAALLAPRFGETDPCAVICADCEAGSPRLEMHRASLPVLHDYGLFKVLTR